MAKHAATNTNNKFGPTLTVTTPCRTGDYRAIGYTQVTFPDGHAEFKRADNPPQGAPALRITC